MVPLYREYVNLARRLARMDPTRPRQGNLRRAVSTAYYALFHFLIDRSSRFLAGSTGERERLRCLLARAYAHGEMASAAKTFQGGSFPAIVTRIIGTVSVPAELRTLAVLFLRLQELRHLADYDLVEPYARGFVLDLVQRVEERIQNWNTIRRDPATRLFLISSLVWDRVRNK